MLNVQGGEQDLVSTMTLQRQRLIHHAGAILNPDLIGNDPQALTKLSQTLVASLELLKVAEEQLAESRRTSTMARTMMETRLAHAETLFECAPTPLLLTTTDSTIRQVNRAATGLLGVDSHSLVGEQILRMVPAAEQGKFRDQLGLAVAMKQVVAWSFRLHLKRSNPVIVTTCLELIEDPAIGARALYWNIRKSA